MGLIALLGSKILVISVIKARIRTSFFTCFSTVAKISPFHHISHILFCCMGWHPSAKRRKNVLVFGHSSVSVTRHAHTIAGAVPPSGLKHLSWNSRALPATEDAHF